MSGSNGSWGDHHDSKHPDRAELWAEFAKYTQVDPAAVPVPLAGFLDERGLTVEDLVAFDTRWTVVDGTVTLVYLFPDAIKFRKLAPPPNNRFSETKFGPVKWRYCRMTRRDNPEGVIVAEGETDAMQLARAYPTWDVACLPNGAKNIPDSIITQLRSYSTVLAALDNDPAGNDGAAIILAALPQSERMLPPKKDWCESFPLDPDPFTYVNRIEVPVYTLGQVMAADFGSYEENNWFSDDILPVTGQCIIHAPQKSLKSVIQFDMVRAIATGTAFAGEGGYEFIHPDGPARVLLFQMEIRPAAFQRRVYGWLLGMDDAERDLFLQNVYTFKIGDNELPRLKIQQGNEFKGTVLRAIEAVDPKVLAFDPLQRLTGEADIDKVNELDKLLDFFAELQNSGLTVISSHHNNKASGGNAKHPNAMTGSQRFGADADSICSVWHDPKTMVADDNTSQLKQRNFTWTLRNGAAPGRSVHARPDRDNPELMQVRFEPMIRELVDFPTEIDQPELV